MLVPRVDFRSGAATWVEGKLFLDGVTAVEAEAVVLAVRRPLQLLQQEDDGVVDDTEHPRAAHPAQRQLLQVEACASFKDTVNHCTPGD